MASAQAEFEQMLLAMSSPDNELRKHAESVYNQTKSSNIHWLMTALVEVACGTSCTNEATKNLALVMLRKIFVNKDDSLHFGGLPPDQQAHIKASLLNFFGSTSVPILQKAASACISALAVLLSSASRNAWSELWPALLGAMTNVAAAPEIRGACCDIFSYVAPSLASNYFKSTLNDIANSLSVCLSPQSPPLLLQKATETVGAFTLMLEDKQLVTFKRLVPDMLRAVAHTAAHKADVCVEICSALVGMMENNSALFSGNVADVLQGFMAVASNPAVDGDARRICVEALLTYVSAEPKACRKTKDFVRSFFTLLFQYLMNPVVESNWADTYESSNEAQDSTDFDVGSTGLDRLCVSVGGKAVQGIATELIMANLGAAAWQQRQAALTALTYIVEGCRKEFEDRLASILSNLVIPRLGDEHPMVRYCALQCIAQCATDFAPNFQIDYAGQLLPIMVGMIKDPIPRIQALAGGTINNFYDEVDEDPEDCEEDERETTFLDPYYEPVAQSLLEAITASRLLFVKHEMLGALSSVLQVGKARLSRFTDEMVPLFQSLLALPDGVGEEARDIRNLKCRAIECTTLLACGVGKARFAQYSHGVCQYLISVLKTGLTNDDPRLRYVLRGWTCMVECLNTEIVGYMPDVMPSLLAVANMDCDVELKDLEVGDNNKADDEDGVETVRVVKDGEGEKRMRIHTSLIEDKSLAITIIMTITDYLKGAMGPYLKQITDCAVDLLDFVAYAEIRETAAQTLGFIAKAYAEAAPDQSAGFVNHVVPQMFVAAREEPETSTSAEMFKSIMTVLDTAPVGALAGTYVNEGSEALQEAFKNAVEGIQELSAAKGTLEEGDELEAEDLEMDENDQHDVLAAVLDVVGILLKKCPTFAPLFHDTYLPIVQSLLSGTDANAQRLGIATLCDFVEHGQSTAVPHLAAVAQTFLQTAHRKDCDKETLQSAYYGLGLTTVSLAHNVPQPHAESLQFVRLAAEAIHNYLVAPTTKGKALFSVIANAAASGIRIIEQFGNHLSADVVVGVMGAVVPHLPLKGDKTEAQFVHDTLVRWATIPHHPVMSKPEWRTAILHAVASSKSVGAEAKATLATLK